MKLVLFNDFVPGVVKGDNVVDVSSVVADIPHIDAQTLMNGLIGNFDRYRDALQRAADSSDGVPINQVRLRAPLPEPGQLVCLAGNYMEDGTRALPYDRDAFLKSTSSVIGDGDTIVLPDCPVPVVQHEAELAFVIGKTASKVAPEDAGEYIFGYTNFIDVSARGVEPNGNNSFFWQKSWDTFGPMGPYLVTADEVPNPHDMHVQLSVAGEVRQDLSTSDMGRTLGEVLEFVSWVITLKPGDVVATGTNHVGLGPIQDGDSVVMEIEGLGKLSLDVKDPWKRTWPRLSEDKMTGFEASVRRTSGLA